MFTIERQFHMKEILMPIESRMTQMPGDNGDTSVNLNDTDAQRLLRFFLPDTIPGDMRNRPFYEIAKYKDNTGNNIGVSAIGDAWAKARQYLMSQSQIDSKLNKVLLDIASLSSGSGPSDSQIQNFMIGLDKYGKSMVMPNIEMSGLTFFTRPRLCLQSSNLKGNPNMTALNTAYPESIAFAIRYLLDTNLTYADTKNRSNLQAAAENSPLINPESPWFTPLSNALTSLSGLPNYDLSAEQTAGGFFGEAQSYVTGFNDFSGGGYNVQCTFRELPGSIIFAIFYYWLEYMRSVVRGDMLAYPDDIDGLIMNYTISIYCFNMDPSMRYITRWAKCTGCFPVSLNTGDVFSKNTESGVVREAQTVSVSFRCNRVEYMKPDCLLDFNTLAVRYCPEIGLNLNAEMDSTYVKDGKPISGLVRPAIPETPFSNFCGLPFIVADPQGYRLLYRQSKRDLFANPIIRNLIAYDVARTEHAWNTDIQNKYSLYQKYDYNDFYKNDVEKMKSLANQVSFDQIVESIKDGSFAPLNISEPDKIKAT